MCRTKSFFLLLLLFVFSIKAESQSIDCLQKDCNQQITKALPHVSQVASISFDVDFAIDTRELELLAGLELGAHVSSQDLILACFYLKQKARFSSILLDIDQVEEGVIIKFQLFGKMIFSKVRVHGYITGKYKYKNLYVLSEGDEFTIEKHDHSLQNIKKLFHRDGFFNVKVKDYISYDYKAKRVFVDLYLERNGRCPIKEVKMNITGEGFGPFDLRHIKKQIWKSCCARFEGKRASYKSIDRCKGLIERFLYRRGLLYSHIDVTFVSDEELCLFVSIELNRKKEFVFFGNHYFSKQDLLESLLLYGKSAWHFPATIISDELRQMYHNKGFWQVEIETREESGKVFCVIHEGKRVRIVGIDYQGVTAFSEEELNEASFQDVVLGKLFDKKVYELRKQKMLSLYKSIGYWDVFIKEESFTLMHENKENCMIFLQIEEGKQRFLRNVVVPGYPELQTEFAELFVDQDVIPFDYTLLSDQKSRISSYASGRGYTNIQVSYDLHETEGGIELVWNVKGDSTDTILGRPVLIGESVVPYHKLSREFMFKKGDKWDLRKLDKTAVNLRELGVFDSVQIYPGHEVDVDQGRPIFIKVVDADRYEARLRVGLQQVGKNLWFRRGFTHKVGGSFFVNNPFKRGDKAGFDMDFTQFYGKSSIVYRFPWLFRLPIRSEAKIYANYYHQPVYIGSNIFLYRATQQGFLFGANRHFDHKSFSLLSGVEWQGLKEGDIKPLETVLDYEKELLGVKDAFLYFEPSFIMHNLDDILNPTSGYRSAITCKAMFDVHQKSTFFKFLAEQSLYTQVMPRAVLAFRGRIGHVFNQEFKRLNPIERFYLGGVNSIRGYYRDYCPPFGLLPEPIEDFRAGLPKAANGLWKYANQGGRTMLSFNTEVRINVYHQLDFAVFTDVGVLFKDSLDSPKENFVGGSGVGIRYNTPVGPLRFDIAWKWKVKHKEFEPSYIWYLTLGQAF